MRLADFAVRATGPLGGGRLPHALILALGRFVPLCAMLAGQCMALDVCRVYKRAQAGGRAGFAMVE